MGAGLRMAIGVGLGGNIAQNLTNFAQQLNPHAENQSKKACIKCYSQLQEGVKFCQNCGQKQGLFCSQCQQKVELKMKFCSECGQNLKGE